MMKVNSSELLPTDARGPFITHGWTVTGTGSTPPSVNVDDAHLGWRCALALKYTRLAAAPPAATAPPGLYGYYFPPPSTAPAPPAPPPTAPAAAAQPAPTPAATPTSPASCRLHSGGQNKRDITVKLIHTRFENVESYRQWSKDNVGEDFAIGTHYVATHSNYPHAYPQGVFSLRIRPNTLDKMSHAEGKHKLKWHASKKWHTAKEFGTLVELAKAWNESNYVKEKNTDARSAASSALLCLVTIQRN